MTMHKIGEGNFFDKVYKKIFTSICNLWKVEKFYHAEGVASLEKEQLHIPGVYFFVRHGIPLYIGKSSNISYRLKESHEEYEGEEIIILPCNDNKQAGYLEEAFRAVFRPVKNREWERKRR